MGIEVVIIPLIIFGVWVLQQIFKANEDNKEADKGRRTRAVRPPQQGNSPRRQVSDLDRFLEETRRRKRQEENRPVVAELVPVQPVPRPPLREPERPAPRPQPPRQERRPAPRPPAPPEPRPALRDQPALVELRGTPRSVRQDSKRGDAAPVASLGVGYAKEFEVTPLITELGRLLKTPQGPALAFVLREILGEPPPAVDPEELHEAVCGPPRRGAFPGKGRHQLRRGPSADRVRSVAVPCPGPCPARPGSHDRGHPDQPVPPRPARRLRGSSITGVTRSPGSRSAKNWPPRAAPASLPGRSAR